MLGHTFRGFLKPQHTLFLFTHEQSVINVVILHCVGDASQTYGRLNFDGCLTLVRLVVWHPYLGGCYPNQHDDYPIGCTQWGSRFLDQERYLPRRRSIRHLEEGIQPQEHRTMCKTPQRLYSRLEDAWVDEHTSWRLVLDLDIDVEDKHWSMLITLAQMEKHQAHQMTCGAQLEVECLT